MEKIKQMCLTNRDLNQGRLVRELLLMAFWIVASLWFFNIPFDQSHISMISVAVAGYAGCNMLYSPESMEQYFWPKILAMSAAGLIGLLLVMTSC